MAELALEGAMYDAACSLAASAGINSSDVLLLVHGKPIPSGSDHALALAALKSIGQAQARNQLQRVLAAKTKAQYKPVRCTLAEAEASVRAANRLWTKAKESIT